MHQTITQNFSSKKSLSRTIHNDHTVYTWCSLLLLNKDIKTTLSKNKNIALQYKTFINFLYLRLLLVALFAIISLAMIWFHLAERLWITFFVFVLLYLESYRRGAQSLFLIFEAFLNQNFDTQGLQQKTLYQIGEFYQDKYGIPSLVDTISSVFNTCSTSFTVSFIFWVFIYPINTFVTFLALTVTGIILHAYFSTFFILKHLQKQKVSQKPRTANI